MRLDKNHLNQFEDISPPMANALTIPVEGVSNVHIYVCQSTFADVAGPHNPAAVLKVARSLAIVDEEAAARLIEASDLLMSVPGAHQHLCDELRHIAASARGE